MPPAVPEEKAQQLLTGSSTSRHRRRPRPHQVAERLVTGIRHPNRRELAGPVQGRQHDRVAPVRLDPLTGFARDPRRRDHDAFLATSAQVPVYPIAAGSGLVAEPQPGPSRSKPGPQPIQGRLVVRHLADEPHLTLAPLLSDRHRDRRLMHVKSDEADMIRHGPPPVPEALHRTTRRNPRTSTL